MTVLTLRDLAFSAIRRWVLPQVEVAYSFRRLPFLAVPYNGPVLQVRRSSDNTSLNLGVDANGDLLIAELLAFCGSGSGFVVTQYDQSGNGRNATQATPGNQPRIVNAGVLETLNGRPTCRFIGVGGSGMQTAPFPGGISQFTANAVVRNNSASSNFGRFVSVASTLDGTDFQSPTSVIAILMLSSATTIGGWRNNGQLASRVLAQGSSGVITSWFDATTHSFSLDGAAPATAGFSAQNLGANIQISLGNDKTSGGAVNGAISEVIWTHQTLSAADRQFLQRDQGAYYGIAVA